MTEPLLTISAFARAVDLAPSTLRYYDEAGLLAPTEVDVRTGYRYYTPDLERRAHMIRRMREVGVPVETMRTVLDDRPDEAAEILQGFAARAEESARRTAAAVADVISSLRAETDEPRPVVVSLDGPELAAALRRVSAAASDEADSPLADVLLDIEDNRMTAVATDRYWMAAWTLTLVGPRAGGRRIAVPATATAALAEWLGHQGTVTISADDGELLCTGDHDDHRVVTATDRFPAYRILMEADSAPSGRVVVDRARLLDAIAGEDSPLLVRIGADRVTLQPQGSAEGVRLPASTTGEPIELGFAASLLRSALTAMVGSEATLTYEARDRAVRITSAEQRSFVALVMPFKLEPAQ